MKRTLLVLGITLAAALPARADLHPQNHVAQSQLQVGGAVTRADRIQTVQHQRFRCQIQADGTTQPTPMFSVLAQSPAGVYAHLATIAATQDTPGDSFL